MLDSSAMAGLRTMIGRNRALFAVLCVLALAIKIILPQGFMLGSSGSELKVMICAESGAAPAMVAIPMKAGHGKDAAGATAKETCPYGALGMGALAAADLSLLATALAFILLLGFAPQPAPYLRRTNRLLPPLRGPPAIT